MIAIHDFADGRDLATETRHDGYGEHAHALYCASLGHMILATLNWRPFRSGQRSVASAHPLTHNKPRLVDRTRMAIRLPTYTKSA